MNLMRKGNLEIEIRFKVGDVKKLREKLCKLGSKCLERWQGRDILFDRKNELISKGRLLRLRLGMEKSVKGKLTFKGPYHDHAFKVRDEFETIVESPEMAVKILAGLGYLPVIQYEKRTKLWKYGGTEIYIEEMPKIGWFMEIEGSERDIKKVAKIIGYDIKEGIKKSYREYFEAIDKKKKEWLFEK